MKKKTWIDKIINTVLGLFFCFSLVFIITTLTGIVDWRQVFMSGRATGAISAKTERKLREIQMYMDAYFLEDVEAEDVENSLYKGLVQGLGDPYAAYYTEEEYEDMREKTSGNYCGIGAYVNQNATTGAITIVRPIKNSPAEKAGLQTGDVIYQVEGRDVAGQDLSAVVSRMKGEPGTKVRLTLMRQGREKPFEVTITRAEIESETVAAKMLDGKVGYIAVSSFEEVTKEQFRDAVEELEKKGEKSLIIDLRDNGGGLLNTAVDMLDRILPEELVVYTEDKHGEKKEYFAEDDDSLEKPIAILVNGNSASASEVFSGALQDYEKAVLVGTTTFGKGIVQSVFDLHDGTALKLTTAEYFTPKGRNIHGTGLEPDIRVELNGEAVTLKGDVKVDNQVESAREYLLEQSE